ncbi:MAG: hypothetical protein WCD49_14005 [Candidatus Acidiferrales bacterium]
MGYLQKLTIEKIPLSPLGSITALAELQGLSADDAFTRIIRGLGGITDADLGFLTEPPNERRHRNFTVTLDWRCLDRLYEMSENSGFTISSIFRRVFYALLVTQNLSFTSCKNNDGIFLQIVQTRPNFTRWINQENESSSPSEQRWEKQ